VSDFLTISQTRDSIYSSVEDISENKV